MIIYKIIKQTSINNITGERKERYVLIETYSTFLERCLYILCSKNPYYYFGENIFNNLEEAIEAKKELENKNKINYTHKNEVVK